MNYMDAYASYDLDCRLGNSKRRVRAKMNYLYTVDKRKGDGWERVEIIAKDMVEVSARIGARSDDIKYVTKRRLSANGTPLDSYPQGNNNIGDKKNGETKKEKPMKTKKTKRKNIFGHSVSKVLFWLGAEGFNAKQVEAALDAVGVKSNPKTIGERIGAGKSGKRGTPAKLTGEQKKLLRNAAKAVTAAKAA